MSPTIFREGPFRFYFFSREETRMHVHVQSSAGEAKFWLEPHIELAHNYGLNMRQINAAYRLVEKHAHEIRKAWKTHFGS
jgi:ribosomal protein L16/L10AE